jgi:hypothetical protein
MLSRLWNAPLEPEEGKGGRQGREGREGRRGRRESAFKVSRNVSSFPSKEF